jgi:hypothetical protein
MVIQLRDERFEILDTSKHVEQPLSVTLATAG